MLSIHLQQGRGNLHDWQKMAQKVFLLRSVLKYIISLGVILLNIP
jgi:hypothetical protein